MREIQQTGDRGHVLRPLAEASIRGARSVLVLLAVVSTPGCFTLGREAPPPADAGPVAESRPGDSVDDGRPARDTLDQGAHDASSGALVWSRRLGSTGIDRGQAITVDSSGNVTVTGACEGTVDFGGGAPASAGGRDIFVASYGPTGAHRWARRFGGASIDEWGFGVAVDSAGNTAVTGQFAGTATFGGDTLSSAGGSDVFLVQLAP